MLRAENVATPATAFACAVPLNVPLDGFVPMAIVIWLVAAAPVVTTLPRASSTLTATAAVIEAPAATLLGCTVNASFVAAPTTLNALLVALVSPVALAVSVYPVPALLMLKFENVATPLTAVTCAVPPSVPLEGFVPMAIVIWF